MFYFCSIFIETEHSEARYGRFVRDRAAGCPARRCRTLLRRGGCRARSGTPHCSLARCERSASIRDAAHRMWRDNNPGAIQFGPFASDHGAIGQDGRFAIFPDADTGHRAMTDLLNSADYRDLTLEQAIKKWAPESENDSETYVANVSSWTGIARDKVLRSMSPAQIEAVASAIRRQEGWAPGTVRVVPSQRK